MIRPTRFVLSLPSLPSPCARAKFVHLLRAVVRVLLLLSVLALAVILSSHPPPGLPSAFGVGKPVVQETRQPAAPATPTPPVLGDLPSVQVVGPPVTSSPEPTVVPSPPPALPSPSLLPTSPPTAEPASPTPVVLRYVFPVRGASVSYGPYHHDYPAADIFCPIGSEYLATTSGEVEFVNRVDRWSPATNVPADRGGIMMAFVGDDGVRYYGSHLSAIVEGIEPGLRVEAGQLLGYTGNSGNASSTPPHLHYGISRPTTPDDWQVRRGEVPPYEYLKAWERGEMVTPRLPSTTPPPSPTPVPPTPTPMPMLSGAPAPAMRGELVMQTYSLDFYRLPGAIDAETIRAMAMPAEEAIVSGSTRFGGEWLTGRVAIRLEPAQQGICAIRGLTLSNQRMIRLFYEPETNPQRVINILAHELFHQLQHDYYGEWAHLRSDTILLEGMATWGSSDYFLDDDGTPSYRRIVQEALQEDRLLPLTTDLSADCRTTTRDAIYEQWASFVEYLLETYGREQLDAVYADSRGRPPGSANYQGVYGKSLAQLEADWRHWLTMRLTAE